MRKLLVFAIIAIFAVSNVYAAKLNFSEDILPRPFDSGGPDDYGYSWEDNDNGGTPVYNWVDITGVGTLVEGLFDDNVVGTFDFGFDFSFYWYNVNSTYIGSNGYLSFSSAVSYSQDFDQIPHRNNPNNIVAPLACDLDLTSIYGTNECYYYTNNVDSFVVSWIDVAEWRQNPIANTEHTFQVILCASDSSITFQYGPQDGDWQNPDGATSIGIEDMVGSTGLSYLHNLAPTANVPHDGLVVRFHPDPDPEFIFEDAGVLSVMNATSGGVFRAIDTPFILGAYIQNAGTVAIDDISVRCQVKRSYWTEYDETITIDHLATGEIYWLEFPLAFIPEEIEVHSIIMKTMMADSFFFNNSDTCELRIFTPLQESNFSYTDTCIQYTSWQGGNGGFGNEFVMPSEFALTSISVNLQSDGTDSYWFVLGADEDGNIDDESVYFADTVNVVDTNWITVDLTDDIVFPTNTKFFVTVLSGGEGIAFGQDTSWPLSNRGWEQVGSYTPSRDRNLDDICMYVTGIAEEVVVGIDENTNIPYNFALSQNYPNPFNATTEIVFNTENTSNVTLDVYNVAGQKIKTLVDGQFSAGSHNVVWNGANEAGTVVSSGVYFYKLNIDNQSETRKMVLIK